MEKAAAVVPRPIAWVGSSKEDLKAFPDSERNAYRAVYTVKFAEFVYVLHCFQKKSKRGAKTPSRDLDLIKSRLRMAEADYKARREST